MVMTDDRRGSIRFTADERLAEGRSYLLQRRSVAKDIAVSYSVFVQAVSFINRFLL